MKKVIFVLLLINFSFSNTFGQVGFLPKGKWFDHTVTGMRGEIAHMEFINDSTLLVTPVLVFEDEKVKPKPKTIILDTFSVNKNSGKLLLKYKENGGYEYIIYLYKWLNKDELQVNIPGWIKPKDKPMVITGFKEPKKFHQKFIKSMAEFHGVNVNYLSMHDSGNIWRSEKLYRELNKLPQMPQIDKQQLIAFYDKLLSLCKQKKNQTFLNSVRANLSPSGIQYLTELAFIEFNYNPFTSFKSLYNVLEDFEDDSEVKSLQKRIKDIIVKGN